MWVFQDRRRGGELRSELVLSWEVDTSAFSDDFTPEEVDAVELWHLWRKRYGDVEHKLLGAGWLSILWSVEDGESNWGVFAPFSNQDLNVKEEDFLARYTWPRNADTGEDLRWTDLVVEDKHWTPGRGNKGGFIQEATGWKPGLLQPYVHIPSIARAAGLEL